MFEKEAEDFLKKSLKVDDDEFDFFKNEASCKEEIKRLIDFVGPREKRIEILENTVCTLDVLHKEAVRKYDKANAQLTKAEEIIRTLYYIIQGRIDYEDNIQIKDSMYLAKAFLSEV